MARKLVSIQKISNIEPIEGADKIERLTILGWHVVASKTEGHKIGDLVAYIEIDTQLPEIPMFEFLKERKYRVKTIKLRGQVSQGLVIPLRELEKNFNINISKFKEGDDITSLIGAKKYDPELEAENKLAEEAMNKNRNPIHKFLMKYKWYRKIYNKLFIPKKGGFPSWISKTDETRLQAIPEVFEDAKQNNYIFYSTEKIDGQSSTYFLEKTKIGLISKYEFGVCSRNLRLKTPTNSSYWTVARQYDMKNLLKTIMQKFKAKRVVIQGEIAGTGIQGNKYKIEGYKLFVFNLIIDNKHYNTDEIQAILNKYDNTKTLKTVPILDYMTPLKDTIDEMVEDAKGKSKIYGTLREGKVWRTDPSIQKISFKVINPEFLLKNKE